MITQEQFTAGVIILAALIITLAAWNAVELVLSYNQIKELNLRTHTATESKDEREEIMRDNVDALKHALAGLNAVVNHPSYYHDSIEIIKCIRMVKNNIHMVENQLHKQHPQNKKIEETPLEGIRVNLDINGVKPTLTIWYHPKTFEVSSPMLQWDSEIQKHLSDMIRKTINKGKSQ